MSKIVLLLGSGPDALRSLEWGRDPFDAIVAINNAWAVRSDWDYLVYADDFPAERLPFEPAVHTASMVRSDAFVPAQNAFGGFVYAGGTMAFTAAYWAVYHLKPDVLAFLGCDMIYPKDAPTHFYGVGTADPLRDDITLRSLEAKSARLFAKALRAGTICVNLSSSPQSRLLLPRAKINFLQRLTELRVAALKTMLSASIDAESENQADDLEGKLGYFVEDGRYWDRIEQFKEESLRAVDKVWLSSVRIIPKAISPKDTCWLRSDTRRHH